jgi:hypothetical protein
MKSKIIAGSSSLLMGVALLILGLQTDPTASADIMSLDPLAVARFKIVVAAACVLIVISFILFAVAAMSYSENS